MRVIERQNRTGKGLEMGTTAGQKRVETRRKMRSKPKERSANVYENKGPLWETPA
jgi:hypothetical protein